MASSNDPGARKGSTKATPNPKPPARKRSKSKASTSKTGVKIEQSSPAAVSLGSPMSGNKRKVNTEENPQIKMSPGNQFAVPDLHGAQLDSAQKRQKTSGEQSRAGLHLDLSQLQPNYELGSQGFTQNPLQGQYQQQQQQQQQQQSQQQQSQQQQSQPQVQQQPQQSQRQRSKSPLSADAVANGLFKAALSQLPDFLPADPTNVPIDGNQIDKITYKMWEIAFKHGEMLNIASGYSSMFSHLKLAALAKLDYLPSWWFFREMTVRLLSSSREQGGLGLVLDDVSMETLWNKTVLRCRALHARQISLGSVSVQGSPDKKEKGLE